MGIGLNIKKLRLERGVTLTELAKAVGVDTQAIYALEKRDSKKSSFAVELAEFFDVSVKTLMSDDMNVSIDEAPSIDKAQISKNDEANALVYLNLQELLLMTKYREASESGRGLIRSTADSASDRHGVKSEDKNVTDIIDLLITFAGLSPVAKIQVLRMAKALHQDDAKRPENTAQILNGQGLK